MQPTEPKRTFCSSLQTASDSASLPSHWCRRCMESQRQQAESFRHEHDPEGAARSARLRTATKMESRSGQRHYSRRTIGQGSGLTKSGLGAILWPEESIFFVLEFEVVLEAVTTQWLTSVSRGEGGEKCEIFLCCRPLPQTLVGPIESESRHNPLLAPPWS